MADIVATLGLATWFYVLVLGCMVILLFLVSLAARRDLPLSASFDETLVDCLRLNSGAWGCKAYCLRGYFGSAWLVSIS